MKQIKLSKIEKYSSPDFVEIYKSKHDHSFGKLKDAVEKALMKEFVKGKVLDGGAGTGRFSIHLAEQGHPIVAADASEAMLEHIGSKNKHISLVRSDIEFLPFKNHSFGSVVSMHVLFHLPKYQEILKEYLRVLRPKGKIIFEMQSGEHFETCRLWARRLRIWSPSSSVNPEDYSNWISRNELIELTTKLGGNLKVCRSYDLFSTYWFGKIKLLAFMIQWFLQFSFMLKLFYLVDMKITPLLHPFFSSRSFIVIEKI